MTQDPHEFEPIPTCDIPPPILEREGTVQEEETDIPRILLQAAGTKAHTRRILLLSALFLLLSILETTILFRMTPPVLVVYQVPHEGTLLEEVP